MRTKNKLVISRETLDQISGLVIYPLQPGLTAIVSVLELKCTQYLLGQDSIVFTEAQLVSLVVNEHMPIDSAKRRVCLETALDEVCSDMGLSNQFEVEELVV